jgi:hypothetical protein
MKKSKKIEKQAKIADVQKTKAKFKFKKTDELEIT